MIDRRLASLLIAAGALPAQVHTGSGNSNHTPRGGFFTKEEIAFLDEVAERILPGSRQAQVTAFIDLVVNNSAAPVQQAWRTECRELRASGDSFDTLLSRGASEEGSTPNSTAGRFFQRMKQMTVFAFYSSEQGLRKELGFLGGHAMGSYPGCQE